MLLELMNVNKPYAFTFIGMACYLLAIFGLGFFVWIESHAYNKTGSNHFSFFRTFPFEMNQFRRNKKSSSINIVVKIIISLLGATAGLMFVLYSRTSTNILVSAYILFFIDIIAIVAFNILTFIKLSNYKLHLIFLSIFISTTTLLDVLIIMFIGITNLFDYGLEVGPQTTILVLAILFLVFESVLVLNPSYKTWDRMVKLDAETYNRPKFCYLAILEWGSLINLILINGLFLITMFRV